MAAVGIVALGFGFGLPYAIAYQRIEGLIEGNPELGLAVGLQGVNFAAIVVVPLVGAALEHGYGRLSFLLLAAFCALVGAVNFMPVQTDPGREHPRVVAGTADQLQRGREPVLSGPHGSASAGQPEIVEGPGEVSHPGAHRLVPGRPDLGSDERERGDDQEVEVA